MPVPKSNNRQSRSRVGADRSRAIRSGAIILALFILLAGSLAVFLVVIDRENVEHGDNLCPKDRNFSPPRVIVVLVDQTDRLTDQHQQSLRAHFRQLLHAEFESEEAQLHRRFSRTEVFSFRAGQVGGLEISHRLTLCNPGDVNGLTKYHKNPDQVRRTFEKKFLERLDSELRDLMNFKDSPQSPILEAIKHVSLEVFADPKIEKAEKSLILVSDALHNTPDLSMFRTAPNFADFYRTNYGNRIVSDLKGAKVQLLLLTSPAVAQQRTAVERFWSPYFLQSKAADFRSTLVP